jgi:hypothetical protein
MTERIVIIVPKLPKSRYKKERWFLQNFGSGVMNSGVVIFIEK